jgi:outer membrane protein TolC
VLVAFQQVEDELAAIHHYAEALAVQQRAVVEERKAVDVYLNQFQQGLVAFTTVVTAELTLLSDEESELTNRQNLFLASVSLIEALGGGWDTTLLPTAKKLTDGFSLLPKLESTQPPIGTTVVPLAGQPSDTTQEPK